VTVKEVNHIKISYTPFLSLATTWFTLADRREINRNDLLEYKEKRPTNGFPLFSLTILL
jgi:hypothetical protein